jgi:hypothetical protein
VRGEIDWNWVEKLADGFDRDALGILHAVEYQYANKTAMLVIDGAHRIKALLERGLGEDYVPVMVHLKVKDDASAEKLYLVLHDNKERFNHNPKSK